MDLILKQKASVKDNFNILYFISGGCYNEKETVFALRKAMNSLTVAEVTEQVIKRMTQTKNNEEFVDKMDIYLRMFK